MADKELIVYTAAWGEYVDLFNKYGRVAMDEDLQRLSDEGWKIEFVQVGFNLKPEEVPTDFLITYLRQIVTKACQEDKMLFLAVPDVIWSKNSVYNMVKLAYGKACMCVAAPYQRVNRTAFLENVKPKVFNSKELVGYTFKYSHPSFIDAFDDKDINCSWAGVAGRKIDDNTCVLMHSMPSVWIAQPHNLDVAFWMTIRCFGDWDRAWLNHLYLTDRVRVVGGSEVAYAIELTDIDQNVPEFKKGMLNNDKFKPTKDTRKMEHQIGLHKLMYTMTR